uniref:Uncharacterized protein n=1 Tax=Anguilla anguilla TaxID=7936 RepID=A0A0E9QGY2_ANGAN
MLFILVYCGIGLIVVLHFSLIHVCGL